VLFFKCHVFSVIFYSISVILLKCLGLVIRGFEKNRNVDNQKYLHCTKESYFDSSSELRLEG